MGARKVRELANLTETEIEILREAPYERPLYIPPNDIQGRRAATHLVELGLLEAGNVENRGWYRATDEGQEEARPLTTDHVFRILAVPTMEREVRLFQRVAIETAIAIAGGDKQRLMHVSIMNAAVARHLGRARYPGRAW